MIDLVEVDRWRRRAIAAQAEAHRILSVHESAPSRAIVLGDLLKKLSGLPVDVQEYFEESSSCLEHNLLRSAIVLSWSGFFHVMCEELFNAYETPLRAARPNWKFADVTELKERNAESQILDAAKEGGLIKSAKLKIYQGHLSTRNQCAHPTLYKPSLNSALGYVDDMISESTYYI